MFPAAGAVGAVRVTTVFVNSLVRFLHNYRKAGRLSILPAIHLQRALMPSRDQAPRILAGFGDWFGSEGYPLKRLCAEGIAMPSPPMMRPARSSYPLTAPVD